MHGHDCVEGERGSFSSNYIAEMRIDAVAQGRIGHHKVECGKVCKAKGVVEISSSC